MIGKHDMFSPRIQAGVEIVRRPGGRLRFSAPGQVNINDAIVIQPKKYVVSSMGARK
jgi:hypothetical protein